jgi:hypothetical protein
MKKILETLKRKWAEYLLEVLVIVIGIITAFYLDAWHTKNLQEDNLITILKKTHLNIKPHTEGNPQGMHLKQIDTILAALDIIEAKETLTKQEETTISLAFSWVVINGSSSYNVHHLNQLVENLPVTKANLALINATEELIHQVSSNTYLMEQMDQQLFNMMTILDKEIVWFNRDGIARFDYAALRESKQSIDYLIRGRRWKNWIGHWRNRNAEQYKVVNELIEERLEELQ